jgi:internalin A
VDYYRNKLLLVIAGVIATYCQGCSGRARETTEDSIIALGGSVSRDKEGRIASVKFASLASIVGGDFNRIRDLPHLSELAISHQRPSLEDFRVIAAYPRLRHIQVDYCNTMNNEALKLLLTNNRIEVLILDGGAFDDDALTGIADLRNLEELWLRKTKVSTKGAIAISGCRSLTLLSLSSTQIDNTAIDHLSTMPRLAKLYLSNTNVSDSSVESLGTMKQLRVLDLNRTRITQDGFNKLRHLIPECSIYGDNKDSRDK